MNVKIGGENSVPVACECPDDTYHAGACKHRVAVAIRAPVLAAAIVRNREHETENGHSPEVEAMTDGGQLAERRPGVAAFDDAQLVTVADIDLQEMKK